MLRKPAGFVVGVAVGLVVVAGCRREEASRSRTTPTEARTQAGTDAELAPEAPEPEPEVPTDMTTAAIADAACPAVTGPYFYRIEHAGKTTYLLGTRHLGVDIAKMPAAVTDALVASTLAVFETAPGDDSDRDAAAPEHDALPAELGAEAWKHYAYLVGSPLADRLAETDPPTALLMLMALYEHKSSALDDQLQQLAIANKIPIEGLETSAFQDRLIRKWLDMRALKAAVKVTDDRRELRRATIEDLTEYCAGTDTEPGPDPKEKADMIEAGYTAAEIDQYEEDLVFSRNRDWIPKLEQLIARGGVFVAVGADHLIGAEGVVSLLGKRGYTVTRVISPKSRP